MPFQLDYFPMIQKNCLNCLKSFLARLGDHNRGRGVYCSSQCSADDRRRNHKPKPANFTCATCSKPIYKNNTKARQAKHGFHFCSRQCKDKGQRLEGVVGIHLPHYGTASGIYSYRTKIDRTSCERCGYAQMPILVVHHKDHNRRNNVPTNLKSLCPNCHAELHYLVRMAIKESGGTYGN